MLNLSRRKMLSAAAFAAALGLDKRLSLVGTASASRRLIPPIGFHKYKVGSIEVIALYDGIWEKPHDPGFIKNASVEETQTALRNAGLPTEFVSIPLTVVVLKVGKAEHHGRFRLGRWPVAAHGWQACRQYAGRRHRSRQDQHNFAFALSSRSHLRLDGEGQ